MSSNHEDWWYTEQFTLSDKEWGSYSVYIPSLLAFDWYSNTDTKCRLEGLTRICFCVSPSSAATGSFWLDDIQLTGQISPAKDFQQTVIIRKEDGFALNTADGVEVYRGDGEECVDASASLSKTYYYAAFSADDRGNWSQSNVSAQWKYIADVQTSTEFAPNSKQPKKIIQNHQLLIVRDGQCYNVLGLYASRPLRDH